MVCPGHSSMIGYNTETEELLAVDYMRTNIDWVFEVPEDGEINDGTKVKKGDIIIQFYKREYNKYDYVVLKDKNWKANIAARKKYEEEQMLKANEKCCDDCCNCACETSSNGVGC